MDRADAASGRDHSAALTPLHLREAPDRKWLRVFEQEVRTITDVFPAKYPKLARGAKLLFLRDPFPLPDYTLDFTLSSTTETGRC